MSQTICGFMVFPSEPWESQLSCCIKRSEGKTNCATFKISGLCWDKYIFVFKWQGFPALSSGPNNLSALFQGSQFLRQCIDGSSCQICQQVQDTGIPNPLEFHIVWNSGCRLSCCSNGGFCFLFHCFLQHRDCFTKQVTGRTHGFCEQSVLGSDNPLQGAGSWKQPVFVKTKQKAFLGFVTRNSEKLSIQRLRM